MKIPPVVGKKRSAIISAMKNETSISPSIIVPGESRVIRAFGDELHFHLTGEQTGGRFTMFTDITPPGGGPPPHYHASEDETFFLLEGRAEFFKDGQWLELPVGSTVHMPRGTLHTFRNPGDRPLKQLITTSPSGFEIFYAKAEAEFAKPGGPDMQRILAFAAEHGIHFPKV
jgi:quercetin dioxygenase-like cupin family protein